MVVIAGGLLASRAVAARFQNRCLITGDGCITCWTQHDREAVLIPITLGSIRRVSKPRSSMAGNCGIEIARKGMESDNHP